MEDVLMFDLNELNNVDPEIKSAIEQELERQRSNIELIASENCLKSGNGGYGFSNDK